MLGLEFGERVPWRRAVSTNHRTNKLDSVWEDGIYLGHTTLSGQGIVGNKDGVYKTRTVRRVPVEDRWHFELLEPLGGVPWKCSPQADEAAQTVQDSELPPPSDFLIIPPEPPHAVFR